MKEVLKSVMGAKEFDDFSENGRCHGGKGRKLLLNIADCPKKRQ